MRDQTGREPVRTPEPRHDAPPERAFNTRAWALAEDLFEASERLRSAEPDRAAEMFWQADHLAHLAETRDISLRLDHEVRAKYGLLGTEAA
jgi:hypothetical protein